MNAAIAYGKFSTSRSGGARESLLTLLNGVASSRDLSADIFQTTPADDPPSTIFEYRPHTTSLVEVPTLTWTDQVVGRIQWRRYLRARVSTKHDLLVTQNRLAPASIAVAADVGVPSVFFVRSLALTGYEKYSPDRGVVANFLETDMGGMVQYPFLLRNFNDYARATSEATYTVANSEFTARKLSELFGVHARVIYPPIELDRYRVEYDGDGYVTMVNPRAEYKGVDVFLELARASPDEDFLLVGPILSDGLEKRARELPNVAHWKWCDDMREAYGRSKVVVVPSRWEEPFGRVPAEAMVSGIPCVVSDRGGLPEVVGDTGEVVEDVNSVQAWTEGIRTALERHEPEAQKRRVERFSARLQVEKFLDVIDDIGV